ncbi:response regulator [Desulfonatronum lacustre]|uniref:response regulator n=1 Tax=Desulfonatronum lacustre TaxID=66849 RepID=UPI000491A182|nr:response regulator transcription factor [Desulfonatronum lacustre]
MEPLFSDGQFQSVNTPTKPILIVDDHDVFRIGMTGLLEQDGFSVVQTRGVQDALDVYQRRKFGAVIVDLSLQEVNGFVLIQKLLRKDEQARIMVLTVHRVEEYVLKAIRFGANGYVVKADPAEEMLFALRNVLDGKFYLSTSMLHVLVKRMILSNSSVRSVPSWRDALSDREQEVLGFAVNGLKNSEIAKKMDLHIKTVEKHRHNAMRKLGADDRAKMRAMLQVIKAEMASELVL